MANSDHPRWDSDAKRRVHLAEMLYAGCLHGENLRMWPTEALRNLARDCARAALCMTEAEAEIFAHFAQADFEKRREAKDGQPAPK
jgi:hypothetical protein